MSAVAGDFYYILSTDNSNLGVLIADVSGHGVGAALVASMLKIAFASQVKNLSDPAKVLTEVNTILHGNIEQSYVTACYVYIDTANGKFHYSNARHPAPFFFRKATKQLYRCSIGGTILSPFPNSTYESGTFDIEGGDRIVLYTDGIVEAKNKSEQFFGDDHMVSLIESCSSESAAHTAEQFIQQLSVWSGRSNQASFDDDLTLLIVDVVSGLKSQAVAADGNSGVA